MLEHKDALSKLGQFLKAQNYCFITPIPLTHTRVNNRPGNEWAFDLVGIFGWSRPFQTSVLIQHEGLIHLMKEAGIMIEANSQAGLRSLIRLSSLDEHLFIHSAFPTEHAHAVFFGPDTYRFAREIKRYLQSNTRAIHRAVDIGCGSGAGAILIASSKPDADVFAVDINEAALTLTSINASLANTSNVIARYSNILIDIEGEFDLIIANPPYLVDANERTYRNGGGSLDEELSLAIFKQAITRLAPGGSLLLYSGVAIVNGRDMFLNAIHEHLAHSKKQWNISYEELDPDIFGEELEHEAYQNTDRIAAILLIVTHKANTAHKELTFG
ncbi:MAG: class I SAM-dependent methyltransferase [Pseudomonadota bacterium]